MRETHYRRHETEAPATEDGTAAVPVEPQNSWREDALVREKRRFGGIKIGSAFFGWVTAMGIAVLLAAVVTAAGAAITLGTTGDLNAAAGAADRNAGTLSLWGAIALAVIMFIAYYCGGYVAARMARFNGALQGLTVWLWAVVVAIIVAIVTAIAGTQYDILRNLNGFPRIPLGENGLTTIGIVTAIVIAVISLIGALLGGMAGMRFHRRVDRVGMGR